MQRIYPQYFAYLASSVIAANFLDKNLSLIDKMCVIQYKNREFYPIQIHFFPRTFLVGTSEQSCKGHKVRLLLIALLLSQSNPEEIFRFFPLIQDLGLLYYYKETLIRNASSMKY